MHHDLIMLLLKAAQLHGDAVGSNGQILDLQTMIVAALSLLNTGQEAAFLADPCVDDMLEVPEYEAVRKYLESQG